MSNEQTEMVEHIKALCREATKTVDHINERLRLRYKKGDRADAELAELKSVVDRALFDLEMSL